MVNALSMTIIKNVRVTSCEVSSDDAGVKSIKLLDCRISEEWHFALITQIHLGQKDIVVIITVTFL